MIEEYITRADYEIGMGEMVANIVELQKRVNDLGRMIKEIERAHNVLTEVCGIHRYMLEKFIPKPLLEAAATEYSEIRAAAIEQERLAHHGIPASKTGH